MGGDYCARWICAITGSWLNWQQACCYSRRSVFCFLSENRSFEFLIQWITTNHTVFHFFYANIHTTPHEITRTINLQTTNLKNRLKKVINNILLFINYFTKQQNRNWHWMEHSTWQTSKMTMKCQKLKWHILYKILKCN